MEQQTAVSTTINTDVSPSKQAWNNLSRQLSNITPSTIARLGLLAGALYAVGWLVQKSWVALLPFVVGSVFAYIMLPVVNKLDRVLPRWLASVLVMGSIFAFSLLFLSRLIPVISEQFIALTMTIPDEAKLATYADMVRGKLTTLPDPIEAAALKWIDNTAVNLRENVDVYAEQAINLAISSFLGLFQAIGFVIGFLVIPSWLLTVLNEQKKGVAAINKALPASVQPDFWALIRIVDRVFNTFVRGQFFLAVIVGGLTYIGLNTIEWIRGADYRYLIMLSIFTGIMALIPTLGSILGSLPVIALGFSINTQVGIMVTIMYGLIWLFMGKSVASHFEGKVIDIHPALLMIIIVALSELGFIWVLLAAPLTAVFRDLFQYVYGRVGDPPLPAGLLPGDALPEANPIATTSQPVPLAYRRGRAARQASN